MFALKGHSGDQVSREPHRSARSHIAEGMSITGDIVAEIDLFLEGRLEGNLRCRTVVIGETGHLAGTILAQEVLIDGSVEGDIDAKTVRLNITASVMGNVRHEVIEIAAGAKVEGRYADIGQGGSDAPGILQPSCGFKAGASPSRRARACCKTRGRSERPCIALKPHVCAAAYVYSSWRGFKNHRT